jgi:hypothetical protein
MYISFKAEVKERIQFDTISKSVIKSQELSRSAAQLVQAYG